MYFDVNVNRLNKCFFGTLDVNVMLNNNFEYMD